MSMSIPTKICKCGVVFSKKPNEGIPYWNTKVNCSVRCGNLGRKASAETKRRKSIAMSNAYASIPGLLEKRRQQKHPSSLGLHWKKTEAQLANKRGAKNPSWKGGITPINTAIRNSEEYSAWRKKVFERDEYTCQECGAKGVPLHADHIRSFAHFPELRLDVDNGRTLCVPCHQETPNFAGRAKLLTA